MSKTAPLPQHTRLSIIADKLMGKVTTGFFYRLSYPAQREMADLSYALADIAREIAPPQMDDPPPALIVGRDTGTATIVFGPSVSASVISAIRDAQTESDLAAAWRETRSLRLGLPAAEQALVIMAWIDQIITLTMDEGR